MDRGGRWISGIAALLSLGSCVEAPTRLGLRPILPVAAATPAPAPVPLPTMTVVEDDPVEFALATTAKQGGILIGRAPAGTRSLDLDGMAIPFADDGRFLIAFDRDAGPRSTIVATLRDGAALSMLITVVPREWAISRLSTLPKFPVPMPEFARLRPGEIAQINAARRRSNVTEGWRQKFLWPAMGRISTLFGSQRIYKNGDAGSYHSGVDVAVPTGTPVLAPADGVVILASDHAFTLEGNLLMIDHGMGINSALMHLSKIVVTDGQAIKRGQVVAYSGATGRVTGAHLHWTLRWRDAKIDPLLVAGPMPGN